MIKLMYCLRRRPEMSHEEFAAYWRQQHAELAVPLAGALGSGCYIQSRTLDDAVNEALRRSRGAPEAFDGVAELYFEDLAALRSAVSSPQGRAAGRKLMADEANFIDAERSPIFIVEETMMIEGRRQ